MLGAAELCSLLAFPLTSDLDLLCSPALPLLPHSAMSDSAPAVGADGAPLRLVQADSFDFIPVSARHSQSARTSHLEPAR